MGSRNDYYLARAREREDYVGALVALVALGTLLFALLRAAHRWPAARLWRLCFATFLILPANLVRMHFVNWHGLRSALGIFTLPCLGLIALALIVLIVRQRVRAFAALLTLLTVFSPFAALMAVRTAWALTTAGPRQPPPLPASAPAIAAVNGPHVVVLVFDELDSLFVEPDSRPTDLNLGEFDQFRKEAVCFDNARAAGRNTLTAIPSLTTGRAVTRAEPDGSSDLRIFEENAVARWSEIPHLFGLARRDGWPVHVVGWHHPYCRIFEGLSSCTSYTDSLAVVARGNGLLDIALENLHSASPLNGRRVALRTYEQILQDARARLTAPGLVWVHLPVPHSPPIFDRRRGSTTLFRWDSIGGYVDNVALADRTLGDLRAAMHSTWTQSTVAIVSDHPWRESRKLDGRSTQRVPFCVKLPGAPKGQAVASPVSARVLPHIALAALRGAVTDDRSLIALATQSPAALR